jgi:hypothetical protein
MEDLVRRGLASESPMLRDEALFASAHLRPEVARPLLEEALQDEPEPLLQVRIQDRIRDMERGQ